MTRTQKLKTILAACHLLLVICGAAKYSPAPVDTLPFRVLDTYGDYTGANRTYGFFAPGVAAQWDLQFSIYGESGPGWMAEALEGSNREVRLRQSTITGYLAREEWREPLAASWAAQQFARHPGAQLINAHVRYLALPSMEDYRNGERPAWATVAVFPFVMNRDGFMSEE